MVENSTIENPDDNDVLVSEIIMSIVDYINKDCPQGPYLGIRDDLQKAYILFDGDEVLSVSYDEYNLKDVTWVIEDLLKRIRQSISTYLAKQINQLKRQQAFLKKEDHFNAKYLRSKHSNKDIDLRFKVRMAALTILDEFQFMQSTTIMRDGCPTPVEQMKFEFIETHQKQSILFNGQPIWTCTNFKIFENTKSEDIEIDIFNEIIESLSGFSLGLDCLLSTSNLINQYDEPHQIINSPYITMISQADSEYPGEHESQEILRRRFHPTRIH